MLPNPSLVEVSVKQAATALAQRAAVVRKQRAKVAFDLSSLKGLWSGMPDAARNGLIGAGVGAGAGLGLSALSDEENPHYLRNALTGAIGGGAIGAGGTMVAKALPSITANTPVENTLNAAKDLSSRVNHSTLQNTALKVPGAIGSAVAAPFQNLAEGNYLRGTAQLASAVPGANLLQDWWRRRPNIKPEQVTDPRLFIKALQRSPDMHGIGAASVTGLNSKSDSWLQSLMSDIRGGKGTWRGGDLTSPNVGVNKNNINSIIGAELAAAKEAPLARGWRSLIPGISQNKLQMGKVKPGGGRMAWLAPALMTAYSLAAGNPNAVNHVDQDLWDRMRSNPNTQSLLKQIE